MRQQQPDSDAVRFTELWETYSPRIYAYACRHVGPLEAQEIVSETFLVAWRRLIDVPGHPLPWLLVVARNTVANHRRSTYRGAILAEELTRLEGRAGPGVPERPARPALQLYPRPANGDRQRTRGGS